MSQVKLSCYLDLEPDYIWLSVIPAKTVKPAIAYVQELGDFPCGPKYFTTRENLPSYLIKVCLGGEGLLDYGGQTYTVRPGQIFWLDCMTPQHYRTSPDTGSWRLLWVHFYGPSCAAYYELFKARNEGSATVDMGADVMVKDMIERLINLYRDGTNSLTDDIEASCILTQIMTRCITLSVQQGESSSLPRYVKEVRAYINEHYAERITLDSLAKELSLNKYYLQKLFKRHMGVSPSEYLYLTRVQRAKQLLRTTDLPINQIAMEVGVSNIGNFINMFKAREDILPSVYRRRWYNSRSRPEEG